jgi:hypothetical protein
MSGTRSDNKNNKSSTLSDVATLIGFGALGFGIKKTVELFKSNKSNNDSAEVKRNTPG